MAEFYKGTIPIIDVSKAAGRAEANPMGVRAGLVPRDFGAEPYTCYGMPPADLETIPKGDWDAYYDEQEEQESSLEHLFLRGGQPAFLNLDQDGDGDCWCYSTGHAIMFQYLRDFPHGVVPRLNPHFIATYLRRFNGGWCGASMKVATDVGCLEEGTGADEWPLHSHNVSLLNDTRLKAAAEHKVVKNVYDIARPVYGQTMTELQLATMGLTNIPAPSDFNEMAHSMCQIRWVRLEKGSYAPLIINSWKGWGHHGLGVLRGMDADGAVAVLIMNPR